MKPLLYETSSSASSVVTRRDVVEGRRTTSPTLTAGIDPPIKMHDNIEQQHVIHRERRSEAISLNLALLRKTIVQFYSSVSEEL